MMAQCQEIVGELGERRRRKTHHEEMRTEIVEAPARTAWSNIPSGVVEKIVSAVPFPNVFKARLLNKEWCSKFADVISANEASRKWPTYCPAFLSSGEMLAFDRSSNSWHTMKFEALQEGVSFNLPQGGVVHFDRQALEGALLCTLEGYGIGAAATIVNLLSGKRRVIACPNLLDGWFAHPPILRLVGTERFQILIRSLARDRRARDTLDIAVYNSSSDSWEHTSHAIKYCLDHGIYDVQMSHASHAYLEGTMYWCEGVMDDRLHIHLVRVFLEDECNVNTDDSLEELESDLKQEDEECLQDFTDPLIEFAPEDKSSLKDFNVSALRCGSRTILVLILYYKYVSGSEWSARAKLYQFDRKAFGFSLIELSTNPPFSLSLGLSEQRLIFLGDEDCVYICGENLTSYHLDSNTWTCHGAIPAAAYRSPKCLKPCVKFEPGLNPFMVP